MSPGIDRAGAAADRMLEVARAGLYRRNPFRVTGLPTDAAPRLVRQRRQLIVGSLKVGRVPAGDTLLPVREDPSEDEFRAAFDELAQIEHRVVDELFWWWGEPGACGCPEPVHRKHDEAVRAHATIIDLETAGEAAGETRTDLWDEAAEAWSQALGETGFWAHVEHRVRALGDRSLDETTVDGLRGSIERALLAPQVSLASQRFDASLIELLDLWDVEDAVVDDARLLAAQPIVDQVSTLVGKFAQYLDDGLGTMVAKRAHDELVPAAELLDQALPHERYRTSATLRNQVAVVLNNWGTRLLDSSSDKAPPIARRLLSAAEDLAVDEDTQVAVKENLRASAPDGPAGQWKQVQKLLADGRFLDAAGMLVAMRRTVADVRDRVAIDDLLQQIQHVRAAGGAFDRSGKAGLLMTYSVILGFIGLAVLVLVAGIGLEQYEVLLPVAVLQIIPLFVVNLRSFLGGPMQAPKAVGVLLLLLVLGALVFEAVHLGVWAVGFGVGAYLMTAPFIGPVVRALARRWDTR